MEYKPELEETQLPEEDFGVVNEAPTTLDQMRELRQKKNEGIVLKLPSGLKFRIVRPNITTLIRTEKMPNALIQTAINQQKGFEPQTKEELSDVFDLVDFLVKLSVKEPELTEEDVSFLDDDDKFVVFNYVMGGVSSLNSFRNELQRRDTRQNLPEVSGNEAEPATRS